MINILKKFLAFIICLALVGAYPFSCICASPEYVNEDFEKHTIGETPDTANSSIVVSDTGKNVTVENDITTGSKAVKIAVPKDTNEAVGIAVDFDNITSGVVDISFDFRAENNSVWFKDMCVADGYSSRAKLMHYGSKLYNNAAAGNSLIQIGNETIKVTFTIDMDEKVYDVSINDNLCVDDYAMPSATTKINSLLLRATDNVSGATDSYRGPEEGTAVYWIDNIKIVKRVLKITDTSPLEKDDEVPIDSKISFTFSNDPIAENVSKANIDVFKNNEKLSDEDFEYDLSGDLLEIHINGDMDYSSVYKVVVKGVISSEDKVDDFTGNYELNFNTEGFIPAISNLEDEGVYFSITPEAFQLSNAEVNMTLKKDNADETIYHFGEEISDIGSYILTINATNLANGKKEKKEYRFRIIEEVPPQVSEVKVTGDILVGSVLTGEYVYSDIGNCPDESTYSWWISKSRDGKYLEIEKENQDTYEIRSEDENKYIKFAVVPKAENRVGEIVFSEPFLTRMKPIATDVTIKGNAYLNAKLTGEYEYTDLNGEAQNGTKFQWYRKSKNGEIQKLDDKTSQEYTITEGDKDYQLIFSVTPSKGEPNYYGEEYFSEPINGPMAPVAKNLSIGGKSNIGQTLAAVYDLYDANDIREADSICRWYSGDKMICEGNSLELKESLAGETVFFVVTPISTVFPYEGEEVVSPSVTIKKKVSSGGSGGGGGGGISSVITNNEPVEENPSENLPTDRFQDLKGHWAKESIEKMADKKMVEGNGENMFLPDNNITRAEIAKLISLICNLDGEQETDFDDIKQENWFYEYVKNVSSNGIMNGADNQFRPTENITREELCVVIANVVEKENITYNSIEKTFDDNEDISVWAQRGVQIAAALKIINGRTENMFFPRANVTRAEAIVMLDRLCSVMEGERTK